MEKTKANVPDSFNNARLSRIIKEIKTISGFIENMDEDAAKKYIDSSVDAAQLEEAMSLIIDICSQ